VAKALFKGLMQSLACVEGKGSGFGVAEDFDSVFGGIYDDAAILAFTKMLFNYGAKGRVESLVQIIREFGN